MLFKHKPMPDPQLAGNAGTLLAVSLIAKLVETGALSKTQAQEVVVSAIRETDEVHVSWARAARPVLTEIVLPEFPAN